MDIHLVEIPVFGSRHSQEGSNCDHLGYRGKGLCVVDPSILVVPENHESHLWVLNGPVTFVFNFIYPLVLEDLFSGRQGGDGPSIVAFKCFYFLYHGITPISMSCCLGEGNRLMIDGHNCKKLSISSRKVSTIHFWCRENLTSRRRRFGRLRGWTFYVNCMSNIIIEVGRRSSMSMPPSQLTHLGFWRCSSLSTIDSSSGDASSTASPPLEWYSGSITASDGESQIKRALLFHLHCLGAR